MENITEAMYSGRARKHDVFSSSFMQVIKSTFMVQYDKYIMTREINM